MRWLVWRHECPFVAHLVPGPPCYARASVTLGRSDVVRANLQRQALNRAQSHADAQTETEIYSTSPHAYTSDVAYVATDITWLLRHGIMTLHKSSRRLHLSAIHHNNSVSDEILLMTEIKKYIVQRHTTPTHDTHRSKQ